MIRTSTKLALVFVGLTGFGLMLAAVGAAAIDPNTAVGIWLFDEDAGAVVTDSSGNTHDGELMGGAKRVADGKFGNALELDGQDDYVRVPHSSAWNLGETDFTIALWVWMDKAPPRDHYSLLGNTSESGGHGYWTGWYLMFRQWGGPEELYFDHGNSGRLDGPGIMRAAVPGGFDYGNWHHYALTRDAKSDQMAMYYDGKWIGTRTWPQTIDSVKKILTIGKTLKRNEQFPLDGKIDELAIFDVTLSENDISALMHGIWNALGESITVERKVVSPDQPSVTLAVSARLPGSELHGFSFDLAFEPSVLQVVRVNQGPLLSQNGAVATVWHEPQVDNETGMVTAMQCRRTEGAAGTAGTGVLATVAFEVVREGSSAVNLHNLRFLGPDDAEITAKARAGWVDVYPHSRIYGVVIDAERQRPLPDVKIEVLRDGFSAGLWAYSDENGKYTLPGVPSGNFQVNASKYPYLRITNQVDIKQDERATNLDFEMKPLLSTD